MTITKEMLRGLGNRLDKGQDPGPSEMLLAIAEVLDEGISELVAAVRGEEFARVHVHEETTETTLAIVEQGDNPLLELNEADDGSITITVKRREDGQPAAQIRMTKARALDVGLHLVTELACKNCDGLGYIQASRSRYTCDVCNGTKLDPKA